MAARERALLVTAHPDDECMFFGPTLQWLQRNGVEIGVLCLSTGARDFRKCMSAQDPARPSCPWTKQGPPNTIATSIHHDQPTAAPACSAGNAAGMGRVRQQELLSSCRELEVRGPQMACRAGGPHLRPPDGVAIAVTPPGCAVASASAPASQPPPRALSYADGGISLPAAQVDPRNVWCVDDPDLPDGGPWTLELVEAQVERRLSSFQPATVRGSCVLFRPGAAGARGRRQGRPAQPPHRLAHGLPPAAHTRAAPAQVVTFDAGGVSGHANHVAVSLAVQRLASRTPGLRLLLLVRASPVAARWVRPAAHLFRTGFCGGMHAVQPSMPGPATRRSCMRAGAALGPRGSTEP